jgi:hypothetical protein
MKTKISFYFVLYLIVLVELLAVIIERDTTEQELNKRIKEYETIQDSLIKVYQRPIFLTVQKHTEWLISGRDSLNILISVSELQSPEERQRVKYFVRLDNESNSDWGNKHVVLDPRSGNGTFYFTERKAGLYDYSVYCTVKRDLPSYLPSVIIKRLQEKLGKEIKSVSDTVKFDIKAKLPQIKFHKPGRY